eukprot:scaffold143659_cov118-Phaeocystis_antarctica.AAC.1
MSTPHHRGVWAHLEQQPLHGGEGRVGRDRDELAPHPSLDLLLALARLRRRIDIGSTDHGHAYCVWLYLL